MLLIDNSKNTSVNFYFLLFEKRENKKRFRKHEFVVLLVFKQCVSSVCLNLIKSQNYFVIFFFYRFFTIIYFTEDFFMRFYFTNFGK